MTLILALFSFFIFWKIWVIMIDLTLRGAQCSPRSVQKITTATPTALLSEANFRPLRPFIDKIILSSFCNIKYKEKCTWIRCTEFKTAYSFNVFQGKFWVTPLNSFYLWNLIMDTTFNHVWFLIFLLLIGSWDNPENTKKTYHSLCFVLNTIVWPHLSITFERGKTVFWGVANNKKY